RSQGRLRRPLPPRLHLRHDRGAQGRAPQPRPPLPAVARCRLPGDAGHARRHHLLRHAALPRQRADPRARGVPRRRGAAPAPPPPPASGTAPPSPPPAAPAPPSTPPPAPPPPPSPPPPPVPTTPTIRCASPTATRAPVITSMHSRGGSAAALSTRTVRARS